MTNTEILDLLILAFFIGGIVEGLK